MVRLIRPEGSPIGNYGVEHAGHVLRTFNTQQAAIWAKEHGHRAATFVVLQVGLHEDHVHVPVRRDPPQLADQPFSFLIGLGLNQIILLFVHRTRPYDAGLTHLIIGQSTDWSFPSDHATATFAIAAAFLFQGLAGRGGLLLIGALLMCVSRAFVGTHYASDVFGGAVTGIIAGGQGAYTASSA